MIRSAYECFLAAAVYLNRWQKPITFLTLRHLLIYLVYLAFISPVLFFAACRRGLWIALAAEAVKRAAGKAFKETKSPVIDGALSDLIHNQGGLSTLVLINP